MKIFKKRVIALLIDSFVIGLFIVSLLGAFPFMYDYDIVLVAIILVPLSLRDLVFRNASIGKKLLRISIYDMNWKKPDFITLIKRSLLSPTVGYLSLFKFWTVDKDVYLIFSWERNVLKTQVIDDKVYKELAEQAKNMQGDFIPNMNELYDMYLKDFYQK